MKRKHKRELVKIIVSSVLLAAAWAVFRFVPMDHENAAVFAAKIAVFAGVYMILGFGIMKGAFKNVFSGELLDERFLMVLASVAAFFIGEYVEGIAVVIFYSVGELFQDIAVGNSRRMITNTAGLRVDIAHAVRDDGEVFDVSPDEVEEGELIEVRPGERIPIDGVVEEGIAGIDTSSLTGESAPLSCGVGDKVFGGTVSTDGLLRIRTTATAANSGQERIIALVEEASLNKSKTERFITKFASVYTPCVVVAALLLAVIPSIITGDAARWIRTAIMFLVVSCPCALVVSIPLAFFAGVGRSSKEGVLVKGAEFLERIADADTWVMDKTGTVTTGTFKVKKVTAAEGADDVKLLEAAMSAETFSNHPQALAIVRYCREKGINCDQRGTVRELPGLGIELERDSEVIRVGNLRFAGMITDGRFDGAVDSTAVYVFKNTDYLGVIELGDEVKAGAKEAFSELREKYGAKRIMMLSGDRESSCGDVAKECGLDGYRAELMPENKVFELSSIMKETQRSTVYIGDGINDAPVLALADIGMAMGDMGQDVAIEAADCLIMNDDLRKLPKVAKISRKTVRIARQNVVIAIGVKLLILLLATVGLGTMWLAVFADVGVLIIAILNSLRVMR